MKPVAIRYPVLFLLSLLSLPSYSESGSEYGDIIKETPEYRQITKEKEKPERPNRYYDCGTFDCRDYRYYWDGPYHYYHPRYAPYREDYYRPGRTGAVDYGGLLYFGITVGESEFDYDDIDNGDTSIFYFGYRSDNSRLGYELSIYSSGDGEVTSLPDIELEVDSINLALTVNSSINNESALNLMGKAGIYFADATLSGPFDRVSESSKGFLFGAAVEFVLNRHFSLRADAQVLREVEDFANDESVSLFTLGGHFIF